jgi:hypothetical protein
MAAANDRLKSSIDAYRAICGLLESKVLSSGTLRQLEELKARLEAEMSDLKAEDPS